MQPVYKLNKSFHADNIQILDRINGFGGFRGDKFFGIEYFHVKFICNDFQNIIPLECRNNFETTLMKVNIDVPPHMDISRMVTVNLYIENSDGYLKFFQFKDNCNIKKFPTAENKSVFQKENLNEVESLQVEKNHAYLLNVKQPHSVENHSVGAERISLCLQTNTYTFEHVYNMLEYTGNL